MGKKKKTKDRIRSTGWFGPLPDLPVLSYPTHPLSSKPFNLIALKAIEDFATSKVKSRGNITRTNSGGSKSETSKSRSEELVIAGTRSHEGKCNCAAMPSRRVGA